jgi:hypothetical protein
MGNGDRCHGTPVYACMGYFIAIIVLLIVIPLLFMMLSRRTTGPSGLGGKPADRGVTVAKPSSDQPSPRGGAVNEPEPGAEKRLPPG